MNQEIMNQIANEAIESAVEEMNTAAAPAAQSEMVAPVNAEQTPAEAPQASSQKTYSTKIHNGFSKDQVNVVYRNCKDHNLFVAKPVLEKMYDWAGKYEAETDPAMEDLRQAACKLVICVFMKNFPVAQKKARYIESVMKKMAA